MKQCCFLLLGLSFFIRVFAETAPVSAERGEDSLPALQKRLQTRIEQPRFAQAQWGIKVISLDTGKSVFEYNADKLMIPASNAKLYTCALALDRLGPDFRIETSALAHDKPDANGVLHGDLIIYGRGDPSFSARFNNGDHTKVLQSLVNAIIAAGVKRIEGGLVGDESYFRCAPFGSGWAWDDLQYGFSPPISALSVDDNAIGFSLKAAKQPGEPCLLIARTNLLSISNHVVTGAKGSAQKIELQRLPGDNTLFLSGTLPVGATYGESVSLANPALSFVCLLKDALRQHGILVDGPVRAVNCHDTPSKAALVEIGSTQSRPLREIVKETLKTSQNLYAQLLLLQVGAQGASGKMADVTGLAEMREFLKQAGVKPGTVRIKEGPGLSSATLVTASASVSLLTYMAQHRCAAAFVDALPIAGVDGTLHDRFKGTAAEKRIWAKTGTKEGISTLSGYVVTKANERLAFSIMLNNYNGSTQSTHDESDQVALTLAEFTGRSDK